MEGIGVVRMGGKKSAKSREKPPFAVFDTAPFDVWRGLPDKRLSLDPGDVSNAPSRFERGVSAACRAPHLMQPTTNRAPPPSAKSSSRRRGTRPASSPLHPSLPVASPPSRARQTVDKFVEDNEVIVLDRSPLQKASEAAPKPPPNAFAPLRDMLQGLGKRGGKGVVAGEKSGASAGKGAVEKRGAPTPSGGAAGKGAAEAWGTARLSEPCSPPLGPITASKKRQAVTESSKRAAEATESSDAVEMGSLLGQAPVETASTFVAARQEKAKNVKVLAYAPPPPDDQGKTYGTKAPFKGPGMMPQKGKFVSEQTIGGRKRFLGTFETEEDQKFCPAICWRVYFPNIDLRKYDRFTAQDEEQWKVYLDAAAGMPTGVWSEAQEQEECRFEE
ncbi:unnamed protein product [Closterium sp. Naga37s-1]|nr:unnamed protein product [Closterium sp. Naga37s-1]